MAEPLSRPSWWKGYWAIWTAALAVLAGVKTVFLLVAEHSSAPPEMISAVNSIPQVALVLVAFVVFAVVSRTRGHRDEVALWNAYVVADRERNERPEVRAWNSLRNSQMWVGDMRTTMSEEFVRIAVLINGRTDDEIAELHTLSTGQSHKHNMETWGLIAQEIAAHGLVEWRPDPAGARCFLTQLGREVHSYARGRVLPPEEIGPPPPGTKLPPPFGSKAS